MLNGKRKNIRREDVAQHWITGTYRCQENRVDRGYRRAKRGDRETRCRGVNERNHPVPRSQPILWVQAKLLVLARGDQV
jgi:hypothetical protein